ncbi:MAG: class I SAM-dependent methyltransferase [Planctomycetota bacterium]
MRNFTTRWIGMCVLLAAFVSPLCGEDVPSESPAPKGVAQIQRQAQAMDSLVTTSVAKDFLRAAAELPAIPPPVLYRTADKTRYYRESELTDLTDSAREALQRFPIDEEFYYMTKYGTPVAYVRSLEILGMNGVDSLGGKRVLDFGYGTVGHLRMMASLGADAVGVDVDPLLPALYSEPGDQGKVQGTAGPSGKVKLVHGRFPAEGNACAEVGVGFDLIISKNTLKNGYIHPAEPVDKRMLVDLGVEDELFVRSLHSALKPGGRVLIYNLCPAPAAPGKKYIPWADGKSPFSKSLWESVGFRVISFDTDDSAAIRAMGRAFEWDKGESPMDLENDLFAWYTLAEKPTK